MKEESAVRRVTVSEWAELSGDGAYTTVRTRLAGESMEPLIRKNRDMVTIASVFRPLLRGDIILFRRWDGVYVVHRIRRIQGDTIITLGDHAWKEDRPIHPEDVLGLVIRVERGAHTIDVSGRSSRILGRIWMAGHGGRIAYGYLRSRLAGFLKAVRKRTKEKCIG